MAGRIHPIPRPFALALAGATLLGACENPVQKGSGTGELARVAIAPGPDSLLAGESVMLAAAGLDARGVLMGEAPIAWSSSDTAIAAVDSGRVTGHRPGRVVISASSGPVRDAVELVVVPGYTVVMLPGLGGERAYARAINRGGTVVGQAEAPDGTQHAVIWEEGVIRDLGNRGVGINDAVAINDSGVVVGTARQPCSYHYCTYHPTDPWIWKDGVFVRPPVEGPVYLSDVNNRGVVAGYLRSTDSHREFGEGFLLRGEEVQWLGKPNVTNPGYGQRLDGSFALEINDAGEVAGYLSFYGAVRQAAIGRNGTWTLLWEELLGPSSSEATALNQRGDVAGTGFFPGHGTDIFVRVDGKTTRIVRFPEWLDLPRPTAIDERGWVVGYSTKQAFLWRDGRLHDLDALVADPSWRIVAASDINESGRIVGWARNRSSGQVRGFVLTPK